MTAGLLSLISYFDRQGIPEALIRRMESGIGHESPTGSEDNEDNSLESTRDDGSEDDIITLRNYFFISVNAALQIRLPSRCIDWCSWPRGHGLILMDSLKDGSRSLSRILPPNFIEESLRTGKVANYFSICKIGNSIVAN
jgi:hypothetical protein